MDKKTILEKILKTNLLPLAFIGDSVHTLYIREKSLEFDNLKMNNYNSFSSSKCKASNQAQTLKNILPMLNNVELEIVRRARNAKPKHQAKNSTSSDYNMATSYEALIGYLYLSENFERLNFVLEASTTKIN